MKSLPTVVFVLAVLRSTSAAFGIGNYEANVDPAENLSIFKPQEYVLNEASLLPDFPGIPEIPRELEIPKIPGIPKIPEIPKLPEVPKIPGVPEIPEIPKIPDIPGVNPQRVCLVVRCFPRWSKIQICRCIKWRK